ncbi:hypothetical protein [Clostridium celatum]|uniref:SynChlorMet cassette protein ScmC n=1 Tax=Clostridium celatum DSM 1785 TaxID=545697 RepID=L1QQK4_9CLOT|nr:hypothetical protein [Clostridium celatum]EKY29817.1 hypothetical protein HMPREF0216_00011 [Clostridium celatum DSM 1785]
MKRIFKIADIKLNIVTPFDLNGGQDINLFEIYNNEDNKEQFKFNIEVNKLKDNEEKYIVFKNEVKKVYYKNNKYYWYYKIPTSKMWEICCEEENKFSNVTINPIYIKYYENIEYLISRLNIQGILLSKEVMILHSSFIIHNNESILFTAPSGTGKSTQASLWEKYKGAEIINGDRSAIGTRNGEYFAYGLPFCGSSNICKNKEAPLKAIVVLKQAKENSVRRLSKIEAFKILLGQVAINRWNKKDMELAMTLIEELIEKVPVVMLSCRPDKEATDVLNDYLNNEL